MILEVSRIAEADLEDGYRFYETQDEGLGDYFLDCLYSDMESAALHAGSHQKQGPFFRSPSKRFPYGIYSRIEGDVVQVWAVLDARRSPAWISAQLGSRN